MGSLTDAAIREHVTPESYRRGEPYYKRGALATPRRSGRVLRALCEGSRAEPYRVTAELGVDGVEHAHCTCPVGAQGTCKHVAALLLAYLHDAEDFAEVADVETALEAMSPQTLRATLHYVLRRHPELELVLEMRFPTEDGVRHEEPVDPQIYRDQARAVFREGAQGLGAVSQLVDALRPLVEIGEGFMQMGEAFTGATITRALAEEILEQLGGDAVRDEDGFLDALLGELAQIFLSVWRSDSVSRRAQRVVLEGFVTLAMAEGNAPPTQSAVEEAILSPDFDEEARGEMALYMRQRLKERAGGEATDSFLLLRLEAAHIDEEVFIERCRALGRRDELVRYLLERDRKDEAITEFEAVQGGYFMALVEAFTRHGLADEIAPIVQARYSEDGDPRLLGWLEQRWSEAGEHAKACSAALTRFYRHPEDARLERVRRAARASEQWEIIRPGVMAYLREAGEWEVLFRALLREEDWDRADATLREARRAGHISADAWLELRAELAQGARHARPHLAKRAYQQVAEQLIEKRALANFKRAASLLTHARQLAEDLDELALWDDYMEELLARYGRFQGLRAALEAVGLRV